MMTAAELQRALSNVSANAPVFVQDEEYAVIRTVETVQAIPPNIDDPDGAVRVVVSRTTSAIE